MEILDINSLDKAKEVLIEIGVSSEGIEIMSKKMVHKIIKIKDLESKAINIIKQNMLSLNGDAACSRDAVYLEDKKSDVILMGTIKQFEKLIQKLKNQPFGLDKIAEELNKFL